MFVPNLKVWGPKIKIRGPYNHLPSKNLVLESLTTVTISQLSIALQTVSSDRRELNFVNVKLIKFVTLCPYFS